MEREKNFERQVGYSIEGCYQFWVDGLFVLPFPVRPKRPGGAADALDDGQLLVSNLGADIFCPGGDYQRSQMAYSAPGAGHPGAAGRSDKLYFCGFLF